MWWRNDMTSYEEQKFLAQNIIVAYLYYGGNLYYLFLSCEKNTKINICGFSKNNSCSSYCPVDNSEIHDIFKLLIKCSSAIGKNSSPTVRLSSAWFAIVV